MYIVGTTNEAARIQWIEQILKKVPAGLTILDAGAGERPYKKFCSHLNYIAQDFGQYKGTGNEALQTGSWNNYGLDIISDITEIPLQDKTIDAIMCTEVLEHIPNPVAALKEFSRLLKSGGYLIITAPFASLTHFAPYHFASGLSRYFYEHHFRELGFTINELTMNGNYFEYIAQENRRIKRVALKYADTKLSLFDRIVIHCTLSILQRLSKKDKGSSELLCYGIHVFAQKD